MDNETLDELNRRFDYHSPNTEQRRSDHELMRAAMKGAAMFVANTVPEGREKSLALTRLEEALFWSNAGIAREAK